jgi:glycosyltransferase involved in cell wall biosynthesis
MDVLLISRCPPFPIHFGDRLIPYHLARELSARRHLIDLVAFYQQPEDIADVPRYQRFFRNVELLPEPQRTNRDYLRRIRKKDERFPASAEQSWSPEMWNTIVRMLQDHAYDVVHLFGGVHVYEYLPLVRTLPNVIVPYESYSLWLERAVDEAPHVIDRWSRRLQLRMARNFESWMFEDYDRTVLLTDRDAHALRNLNPHTPTVVIPNGVDVDFFTSTGYEPDDPAFLFVGNYDYPPNVDAALHLAQDIFPRIKAQVPRAHLFLVGGQPPRELVACASDSVEVTGRVPDIRPYFESSLIFISPLRLGAGIKNKVLEAMAMEMPVVATPLSCDGIPVTHGRDVLLGETDDELIDHVIRLLRDSNLRQTLRRNGRRLIEAHFTWQRVADQYESLYQQVIREHVARARAGLT